MDVNKRHAQTILAALTMQTVDAELAQGKGGRSRPINDKLGGGDR